MNGIPGHRRSGYAHTVRVLTGTLRGEGKMRIQKITLGKNIKDPLKCLALGVIYQAVLDGDDKWLAGLDNDSGMLALWCSFGDVSQERLRDIVKEKRKRHST